MDNDECLDFQLGGNIECTHGLSTASLKTDHSVVRGWFQVSVHDFNLGRTNGPRKCPSVRRRCSGDFRDRFAPSGNPKLFGNINEVLSFVVDGVFLHIPRVHKDGRDVGFDREFFAKSIKMFNG